MILGVDPGMTGAMVLYDDNTMDVVKTMKFKKLGNYFDVLSMKNVLREWMALYKVEMAVIEKVASRPGQGAPSTFKFGMSFGMQIAVIASLEIPYTLVTPATWCKEIHQGISGSLKPKEKSQLAMSQLFPKVSFRGLRSSKHNDGLVDALFIAEYWRRKSLKANA